MGQVPQKRSSNYLIIGNGRMACHFAHYLSLKAIPFEQWHRKTPLSDLEGKLQNNSVIFLLINDAALEEFYQAHPSLQQKTVVHFSGALEIPGLISAHPLMTFTPQLYDLALYEKLSFVMTDKKWSFKKIIPELENASYYIEPQHKAYYHALCVLGGNFPQILWQKLFNGLQELELPASMAELYLKKVLENFLQNPQGALTGPLARRDVKTIESNLDSLEEDPFQNIYQSFADLFEIEILKKEGDL